MAHKKSILESTLEKYNFISNYNTNELNKHLDENRGVINEEKQGGIKFVGTDLFESTKNRLNALMEYTIPSSINDEADDQEQPNPNDGAPDGGGMPPMGGQDPNGGGMPPMGGQDPNGGGIPPMGGQDPNGGGAPDGGGMPPMGGQDPNGGAQPPEGFNPQFNDGMDPNMPAPDGGGMPPMDGGDGAMQPDDEVVDITELTDKQDETEDKVEKLGDKFDKVFQAIGKFEELLRSNDEKIENLRTEFEKRNPTQIEKLSMQTDKSYPFNVKPDDFWRNKEATSNYSTEYDNNGKEQGQYAITSNDIKGAVDWNSILDSLDDDDFIYDQTLDRVLKY